MGKWSWQKVVQVAGCVFVVFVSFRPLDFLISPRHRVPYILLYALLANKVFYTFLVFLGLESSSTFILNILYKLGQHSS